MGETGMSKSLVTEELDRLFDGILTLKTREECYAFFEDLCTMNELLSMGQRIEVANMLAQHKTYHDIADLTGASTATISRINRTLNYGNDGYELILKRMKEETQK